MAPRASLQGNKGAFSLTSGAHAASGVSADLVNNNAQGVAIFIDIAAISGTAPTMTFKLQALDPVSGKYFDIPGAVTTALAAVASTMLMLYPGVAAVANSVVNAVLPHDWRLVWTIGGSATPSLTFTASAAYLK